MLQLCCCTVSVMNRRLCKWNATSHINADELLCIPLQVCAQILIDTFADYEFPKDCPLKEIRFVIFDKMVYAKFVEYFTLKQGQIE